MPTLRPSSNWEFIRKITLGAVTTFSDDEWSSNQDIAGAKAANSTYSINPNTIFPSIYRATFMITVLGVDGKPVADQGAITMTNLFIDELAIADGREERLVRYAGIGFGSGFNDLGTTPTAMYVGVFILGLNGVANLPGVDGQSIVIQGKLKAF